MESRCYRRLQVPAHEATESVRQPSRTLDSRAYLILLPILSASLQLSTKPSSEPRRHSAHVHHLTGSCEDLDAERSCSKILHCCNRLHQISSSMFLRFKATIRLNDSRQVRRLGRRLYAPAVNEPLSTKCLRLWVGGPRGLLETASSKDFLQTSLPALHSIEIVKLACCCHLAEGGN